MQKPGQSNPPAVANKRAGKVRTQTRKNIMAAYEAYTRREPGSKEQLFKLVRDFAYLKVYHLEYDFRHLGTAETADDWAQKVALDIWIGIDKFEGSPELFYSWVHKSAYNRAKLAFKYLDHESKTKVSLTVDHLDEESGEESQEDNPEIYEREGGSDFTFTIPKSVQGLDLDICKLILDGESYAEIAASLDMTEGAVKMRLERLRLRLATERQAARLTRK